METISGRCGCGEKGGVEGWLRGLGKGVDFWAGIKNLVKKLCDGDHWRLQNLRKIREKKGSFAKVDAGLGRGGRVSEKIRGNGGFFREKGG